MNGPGSPRGSGKPGVDVPDHRGRVGLDRVGRELSGNPGVVIREVELTSAGWHVLRRTTFDYRSRDGRWETQQRETYDRGNGATILLYDLGRRTVLLTRQFRFPAYVNDHPDGMLTEAAAGLLDDEDPDSAIRREAAEELGVTVGELTPVFTAYMSPGSVTERLHFYAAPYAAADRIGPGGGVADEGEDIEVVELDIEDALRAVLDGRIVDGKTIMLLQWAALTGPFAATEVAASEREPTVRLIRSDALSDRAQYAYAATPVGRTRPVHLAGACPLDRDGNTVALGDVAGQARQCLANLIAALHAAGADLADVIYTRVLVATTSRDDLSTAWNVVHETFDRHDVPSTLHGVTVLGYPGQLVEIEAVAAVRDR